MPLVDFNLADQLCIISGIMRKIFAADIHKLKHSTKCCYMLL